MFFSQASRPSTLDATDLKLDIQVMAMESHPITQVAGWLKAFRSATTQMSTTKQSMLSTAHAIFCGLQDKVRDALCSLPDSTSPMIKDGLLAVHQKLSEYYYHIDLSPFYIWAACESYSIFIFV